MPRKAHHSPNYGGHRPGAGRKKGSTATLRKEAWEMVKDGEHPVEYLLNVMRNEEEDERRRIFAASAMLPYLVPKLSQATVEVQTDLKGMTMEQKIALAQGLRERILEQEPEAELPDLPALNGESTRV